MSRSLDMGGAARRKRDSWPTKSTMNLYFREDRAARPAAVLAGLLVALAILAVLGKLLILDRLAEEDQLAEKAARLEAQAAQVTLQLEEYPAVEEDYVRLALTDRERALADRAEVLDLIDRVIRPAAELSRVTIRGQQALVEFSGATLEETAALVIQLEQSPLVERAAVSAVSAAAGAPADVELLIQLTTGEEDEP